MDHPSRPVPGSQSDPGVTPLPPATSGPPSNSRLPLRRDVQDARHPETNPSPSDMRDSDETTFLELRRKVQSGELLSASTERLLWKMRFNGHLTVLIQRGRVIKSGYEEGYFRRKNDLGGLLLDS